MALAAETPSPAPAKAPAAEDVKTIAVAFRGSLRDALKRIAEDGGLNVVATGDLDTAVEVHLKGVTAEQALRTIARTYSLRLDQEGSIFTLRPMTAAEKEAAVSGTAAATPALPPGPERWVCRPWPWRRLRLPRLPRCPPSRQARRRRRMRWTPTRSGIGSAARCARRSAGTRASGTWWPEATRWR